MGRKKKKMFRTPKTARRQARKRRSKLAGRREREAAAGGPEAHDLKVHSFLGFLKHQS